MESHQDTLERFNAGCNFYSKGESIALYDFAESWNRRSKKQAL